MKKKNYIIATLLIGALLVGGIGITSAYQGNFTDSDEDGTPNELIRTTKDQWTVVTVLGLQETRD